MWHAGPSSIGIDTIYRSGGNIPHAFLRGCGLADWQIEMVALHRRGLTAGQVTDTLYRIHELLVAGAIQFHRPFISYSTEDKLFVEKLYDDLQDNGVRCWFAPKDMKIGDKVRDTIDRAIFHQEKLLLVLSEAALASHWVESEVETALEKERQTGERMLFPITLDDAVFDAKHAWAKEVRRYHIGNFTRWADPHTYQAAFQRLLKDLQKEN